MADQNEILDAMAEYARLTNGNARLRKMNRDWTKTVVFHTTDTGEDYTMVVKLGEVIEHRVGPSPNPDILVSATSEIFCDMFWGDLNPTQKYLSGELQLKGSQEDIMRLDAISAVVWPD